MKLVITGEMVAWLKDGYPRWRVAELTERFNRRFGTDAKKRQIKDAMYRLRITSGRKAGTPRGSCIKWRPEIVDWLREHRESSTLEELAPKLNARFGTQFKPHSIQAACKRYGVEGVIREFKAGNRPWNKGLSGVTRPPQKQHSPIFTYRQDAAGIWSVKVNCPEKLKGNWRGSWARVHHLTYRDYVGPIPKGHMVIFLDGDRDNCLDPDNLIAIERAVLVWLNLTGWNNTNDVDIRRAMVALAKLVITAHRRGKDLGLSEAERMKLI